MMKIIIPAHLRRVLDRLASTYDTEFMMFGKTQVVGGDVCLTDLRVPHQTSSAGETECSEDESISFLEELINSGENPQEWNMWIHSHHHMGAFWSPTDKQQMESFNRGGVKHFFHIVISSKGWKAAYSSYSPFEFTIEDVPIEYAPPAPGHESEIDLLERTIADAARRIEELSKMDDPNTAKFRQDIIERNKARTYTLTETENASVYYTQLRKRIKHHGDTCACELCEEYYYALGSSPKTIIDVQPDGTPDEDFGHGGGKYWK
jgi:hypothetical protein